MKIAIVGVGHVGATLAYTLLGTEPIDHLLLIGRNQSRLEGEALDLRHASAFVATPPKISFGSVADCSNADIVVLTLAVPQDEPDRNAKVAANARLFAEVVPQIAAQNPNSILLVATNPVEAMTQLTIELSGFGSERVVGTGTIIDSCRLRVSLSEHLGVHPDDLRAYVLGEHGDSQFVWRSGAAVGGVRLLAEEIPPSVIELIRSTGTDVFRLKGHTSYAIGQAMKLIIHSIAGNRLRTMPVSTQVRVGPDGATMCLALPCVVGRTGVQRVLLPQFSAAEQIQWDACARSVAATLEQIRREATPNA